MMIPIFIPQSKEDLETLDSMLSDGLIGAPWMLYLLVYILSCLIVYFVDINTSHLITSFGSFIFSCVVFGSLLSAAILLIISLIEMIAIDLIEFFKKRLYK